MGSDMFMAEQNFRPRPSYAEWNGNDLVIYTDKFYHGYREVWRGPVTDSNKSLILKFVPNIPEKPKPKPVEVTITFTPEEYAKAENWCSWDGGVAAVMKKAALGESARRGC